MRKPTVGVISVTISNSNSNTKHHESREHDRARGTRPIATRTPPHTASADRRHLFATDLVNNGLPTHIGAALLGHLNLQTTRGYVAVFNEDVVRHYQEYLERRRGTRPDDEYRKVTEREWSEFEEHFDRRKVELGGCMRPYGTPCQHEHSCLRCPMLAIKP
jgi:Phage integrase family